MTNSTTACRRSQAIPPPSTTTSDPSSTFFFFSSFSLFLTTSSKPNPPTHIAKAPAATIARVKRDYVVGLNILPQEEYNPKEPPNPKTKKFFNMLKAMETPLVDGDDRHSVLFATAELYIKFKNQ
ncbi:hypothetical protein M9H77_07035 [Catharanthus roseus]|uniref:Uncharacterized protein n=1 Tax=Catharanthus roseus TaxID=4058 RepID=A0ACC0BTS1_CATRO|nr:hypothetical protein M9H77_07035 [Catharanthus roseus]